MPTGKRPEGGKVHTGHAVGRPGSDAGCQPTRGLGVVAGGGLTGIGATGTRAGAGGAGEGAGRLVGRAVVGSGRVVWGTGASVGNRRAVVVRGGGQKHPDAELASLQGW
mmetsp:Transcript_104040/g.310705  ORF Transcript_104040/g.310705 Transcript_104040/m.310705 type:complete len:109 (+) Transcript_104040:322-648(+)